MFSYPKILQVSLLSVSHASLLSWSVHPSLAKPDVMNNTRVSQLAIAINSILARPVYSQSNFGSTGVVAGGAVEQLLRAIAPNCTQLILQCSLGKLVLNGWDCCTRVFDPNPYFTQAGKSWFNFQQLLFYINKLCQFSAAFTKLYSR